MGNIYNFLSNVFQEIKQENNKNRFIVPIVLVLLSIPLTYFVNSVFLGLMVLTTAVYFKKENFRINYYLLLPIAFYILMLLSTLTPTLVFEVDELSDFELEVEFEFELELTLPTEPPVALTFPTACSAPHLVCCHKSQRLRPPIYSGKPPGTISCPGSRLRVIGCPDRVYPFPPSSCNPRISLRRRLIT